MVIYTICPSTIHGIPSSLSYANLVSSNSECVKISTIILQSGPCGFILVGYISSSMGTQTKRSFTFYPKFLGKGEEDVEKHWFLCECI